MIPFLQSIAKAYASRYADLSGFCFLFPNKRSGTFFLKYLQEENSRHVVVAPAVKSISEFVSDISRRAVASKIDLLFLLYESYIDIMKEKGGTGDYVDFDSFRSWGEIVLSDFSDIDLHLANAGELFKNVKDFRELSSNFLSEEQKSVMEEYFGHTVFSTPETFWRNFDEEEENLSLSKKKFLHLWRILGPLYDRFNDKLEEENLATTGGAYREAYRRLADSPRGVLGYKKVVAIGFNALSASEKGIFELLRDSEPSVGHSTYADFFWDATGPILTKDSNSASTFVMSDIQAFPSPEWSAKCLQMSDKNTLPEKLEIIASPSNSAQSKIAGDLLSDLIKRLDYNEFKKAKVAVVLPDESLLLPMLYSLPENMGDVNLTMGYSLRMTNVVPFVSYLRNLLNSQKRRQDVKRYSVKDLRTFLCHPFSRFFIGADVSGELIAFLRDCHLPVISADQLKEYSTALYNLLTTYDSEMSGCELVDIVENLLKSVYDTMKGKESVVSHEKLELANIDKYLDSLRRLKGVLNRYQFKLGPMTVFRLLDRLISQEKVGFEGEPLSGLQIMGTLETRSIDFDYLVILSANERILPMRHRTRSFIPDTLRRAYGIPSSNYAENIFSYYFYRMISRATEVSIVYDARTGGGGKSAGMSRYLFQLRHLFGEDRVEWKTWKFRLAARKDYDPTVTKNEKIREWIERYSQKGSKVNFSASSLNTYRECQVKFFYRHVLNIDTDPEPSEFIDAIMAGNIVHRMLLELYVPEELRRKMLESPIVISKERLENILSDKESLRSHLRRIINSEHHKLKEKDLDTPLNEASEMVGEALLAQVINVLKHDLSLAPFRVYGCEISETIQVKLKSGRLVNFRFAIDRLDEIDTPTGPRLRIVDYKTGKTKLTADSVESLFDCGYKQEQIFQLYVYAWLLLVQKYEYLSEDIWVEIYNVADIHKNGTHIPTFGKEQISRYQPNAELFDEGLNRMIESIFTSPSFDANPDPESCGFCNLKSICRR